MKNEWVSRQFIRHPVNTLILNQFHIHHPDANTHCINLEIKKAKQISAKSYSGQLFHSIVKPLFVIHSKDVEMKGLWVESQDGVGQGNSELFCMYYRFCLFMGPLDH